MPGMLAIVRACEGHTDILLEEMPGTGKRTAPLARKEISCAIIEDIDAGLQYTKAERVGSTLGLLTIGTLVGVRRWYPRHRQSQGYHSGRYRASFAPLPVPRHSVTGAQTSTRKAFHRPTKGPPSPRTPRRACLSLRPERQARSHIWEGEAVAAKQSGPPVGSRRAANNGHIARAAHRHVTSRTDACQAVPLASWERAAVFAGLDRAGRGLPLPAALADARARCRRLGVGRILTRRWLAGLRTGYQLHAARQEGGAA